MKRGLKGCLLLLLLVLGGLFLLFFQLGNLLYENGGDQRTDWVFCSNGSEGRMRFAIERVQMGSATRVLLAGDFRERVPLSERPVLDFIAEQGKNLVGSAAFILIGSSTSTIEDARCLGRYWDRDPGKTVLVTTDGYNLRRVRKVFLHILGPRPGLHFCATPARFNGMVPATFYQREVDFLYVFSEILKTVWYAFRFRIF